MEHLTKSYPKMYRMWLTKHVSCCYGTNKQFSYLTSGWSALGPYCGNVAERVSHGTQCREPGRRKMLRSSVKKLEDWMYGTIYNYTVVVALSPYLMIKGERTHEESLRELDSTLGDPNNNCLQLARETNSLGWDCLLEGRCFSTMAVVCESGSW